MQATGADSVIHALEAQGGVYIFGRMVPIWGVILVEFIFAYGLECVIVSPYYEGFHILTLLANWLKLVCYNQKVEAAVRLQQLSAGGKVCNLVFFCVFV